jgi:hypothetical protein
VLAAAAVASLMTFLGDQVTAAQERRSEHLLVAAVVVAVVVPLVGLAVALWARRRGQTTAFGVAAAIAALGAAALLTAGSQEAPRSVIPSDRGGGGCQEHSGGDNRCPGG